MRKIGRMIMSAAIPADGKPLRKWNVKLYMFGSRLHNRKATSAHE